MKNSSLTPESDIETWTSVFFSVLEPREDFKDFLSSLIQLMNNILNEESFPPKFKEYFFNETLPGTIKRIIHFQSITNYDAKNRIREFLRKAVQFISYSLENNIEQLFTPLILMLDPNAIIYQKNTNAIGVKFFPDTYEIYFNSKDAKKVPQFFESKKDLTISQFNFIFKIYSLNYKGKFRKRVQELASSIMEPYVEYINEIENLHDIDTRALQDSLISFFDLISETRNYQIYLQLFTFLTKCLESDMIEKQAIAAKTMSSFCNTGSDIIYILSNSEIKECIQNLLDKAVNSELSIVVINLFIPFFETMCNQKVSLIDFEHICKLYDIASNSTDSEQQSPLFSFIANALDGFPEELQYNVIDYITRSPTTSSTYKFLTKMTKKFWREHQDTALKEVSLILSDTGRDQSAREAIISIYKQPIVPVEARTLLVKEILKVISNNEESSEFVHNVLCSMIDSTNSLKEIFTNEINNEIIEKMTKNNREYIFKILTKLFNKSSIHLTQDNIQFFSSFGTDDKLWAFYRDLTDTNKLTHSEEIFNVIVEQASEHATSSQITKVFVDFLISLIGHENKTLFNFWKKKNLIERSPKYIDILFTAFVSSTDDQATNILENYILQIYTTMKPIQNFFFIFIQSHFDDSNFIKNYNFLKIILKFIEVSETNIDPEDFGHPRHKYSSDLIILNCTKNDQFICKIHIKPDSTLSVLLQRIAIHESDKKVTSTKFTKSIDEKKKISDLGIKNGDNFAFSLSYENFDNYEMPLSLLLMKNDFVKKLLSISNDELDAKFVDVIEKLLNVLPTDENIYNNKFSSMKNFVSKLKNGSSSYIKKKYYLQTLLSIIREKKEEEKSSELESMQFIKYGGIDAVINLLMNNHDPFYFEFLNELFYRNEKSFATSIETIILCFFNSVIDDWCNSYSFRLFKNCSRYFEQEANQVINSNQDLFNQSLESVSEKSWDDYVKALYLDSVFLLKISMNSIKKKTQVNLPFYIKLLLTTIKTIIKKNKGEINEIPSVIYSSKFLSSCCSMLEWKEVKSSIGELVEIIFLITENFSSKNKELKDITQNHEKLLISIIFTNSDPKIQQKLVNIIKLCYTKITEDYLDNLFSNNKDIADHWNYSPELFQKESPYIGLRNLGATCFFNSIIQQLYHLFPVQYLMATYKFTKDSELNLLQSLFLQMHYSERKYCDTEPFISQWHGWLNELINTREQHDAVEFFGFLIDVLPDPIKKLFSGKLINTITRSNGDIFHSDSEAFINLSVSIKGISTLEESLLNIIAPEELQKQDDLTNKKITVFKSLRIEEAPPVLVIHLKRFEYLMKTYERKKLNDRFTFPNDLNLDKISQNPTNTNYKLVGIVVHSGTAIGGHYISFVKKNANRTDSQWWKFNDIEVCQVSNEDVESASFGSATQQSSAYVLFYIKEDFILNVNEVETNEVDDTKNDEDNSVSFFKELDYTEKVDIEFIRNDNLAFRHTQSMFSEPIIDLVSSIQRNVLLSLNYFCNVLCHSQFEKQSKDFSDNLIERIEKYNQQKECLFHLFNDVHKVYENLLNVSYDDIVEGLCNIIICCSKEDISICIPLLNLLKGNVYSFRQTPAIYEMIYKILKNVINKYYSNKSLEIISIFKNINDDDTNSKIKDPFVIIYHKISEIITLAYTDSRPQLFPNLNFSHLFNIIQELIGKVDEIDLSTFKDFESMIIKSNSHYGSFKKMMTTYKENGMKKKGIYTPSTSFLDQSKNIITTTLKSKTNQSSYTRPTLLPKAPFNDQKKPQREPTYLGPRKESKIVPLHIVSEDNDNEIKKIFEYLTTGKDEFEPSMAKYLKDKEEDDIKEFYCTFLDDFKKHLQMKHNFIRYSPKKFIQFFIKPDICCRKQTLDFYKKCFDKFDVVEKTELAKNFTEYIKQDFKGDINSVYNKGGINMTNENSPLLQFIQFYNHIVENLINFQSNSVKPIFDLIQLISAKKIKNDMNLKLFLQIYGNLKYFLTNSDFEKVCDIILDSESPIYGDVLPLLFIPERKEKVLEILQTEKFMKFTILCWELKLKDTSDWTKKVRMMISESQPIIEESYRIYKEEKSKKKSNDEMELNDVLAKMDEIIKNKQPVDPEDIGEYITCFFKTVLGQNPNNNKVNLFQTNLEKITRNTKEIGTFTFDPKRTSELIAHPSFPPKVAIYNVLRIIFDYSSPENDNQIYQLVDLQIKNNFKEIYPNYLSDLIIFLLKRKKEDIIKGIADSLFQDNNYNNFLKVCEFISKSIKNHDESFKNWDVKWLKQLMLRVQPRFYRKDNKQHAYTFLSTFTETEIIKLFSDFQGSKSKSPNSDANYYGIACLVSYLEESKKYDTIQKLKNTSELHSMPSEKKWKLENDEKLYVQKVIKEIGSDDDDDDDVCILDQKHK